MDYNKKMTRAGGISIPAALRRDYGLEAGDRFNVSANGAGEFILKRTEGKCMFCGVDQNIKTYQGRQICRDCTMNILKVWEG